ncbi:MAG TPA: DUF4199 domain-containing protein [Flavobacterium sp.]|jgi:hypothetical protein
MKETTVKSPAKFALQFGALFGIIMILEFVILYVADIDPISMPMVGTIINVVNFLVLPVLFISLACTSYKKMNGGFISFGQCLKIGVTLCLIAGVIYSVFASIWAVVFPEYTATVLRKTRAVMVDTSPELTEDQIDMALSMTEKFMNPALMIPVTILTYCVIGLLFSLIIGAIVKKDPATSF